MQKSTCIPHCLRYYDASPHIEVCSDKRVEEFQDYNGCSFGTHAFFRSRNMHKIISASIFNHDSSLFQQLEMPSSGPWLGAGISAEYINEQIPWQTWYCIIVDMYSSILVDTSGMFDVSGVYATRDLELFVMKIQYEIARAIWWIGCVSLGYVQSRLISRISLHGEAGRASIGDASFK